MPSGDPPSFERDIRPLFRDFDVEEMAYILDLRAYEEVREYAELIQARVRDGSMPCDEPWPPARVELYERWCDAGHPP